MQKKNVLFLLLFIGIATLAFGQYAFYENFEGLVYPPAGWTMSGVARVSLTTSSPIALGVPVTSPHGGVYCVGMSQSTGNFMMTPLLPNPATITYFHKKADGNYRYVVEWSHNSTGPWTPFPGYPMFSQIGWNPAGRMVDLTGMTNVYVRWRPELPPPNPPKYFYFDDITITLAEPTVPVELASFTASLVQQLNQQYFVELNWTTQSETETAGYNVFRNNVNRIESATQMTTGMIEAANTSITTHYSFTDAEAEAGTWYYWLQSNSLGGVSEYFGPISITVTEGSNQVIAPVNFTLSKLGPNPFNPANSTITGAYGLSKAENVQMIVYNVRGQKVRTLINGMREAGYHNEIVWDGKDDGGRFCKSGMYYLSMTTGNYSTTRKISIIR